MIIVEPNRELKKHTSAIHTSGKLSLLERKLSNVLLYNAYDQLLTNRTHQINIYLLAEISGFNSNDMRLLKASLRKLKRVEIEWDILEEDGTNTWGTSNLLASVEINSSTCTYEYSAKIAEKLSTPDLYGIISLEIQKDFTSGYALTIYEICSRYKGLLSKRPCCYSHWYSLEHFKQFLGVDTSDYYQNFKELNRKIIKPSVHEINGSLKKYAGTDIQIDPEYKKKGRFVSDIRFKISPNSQSPLPLEKNDYDDIRSTKNYSSLVEYGFSDRAAIHVIQTNDEKYVSEKLAITAEAVNTGSIRSVSGYLKKAIDENYQPKLSAVGKQSEKAKKKEAANLEQQEAEDLRSSCSAIIRSEFIDGLSDSEKQQMLLEISKNLTCNEEVHQVTTKPTNCLCGQ